MQLRSFLPSASGPFASARFLYREFKLCWVVDSAASRSWCHAKLDDAQVGA
jgi:hypothetical protein